MTGASCGNCEYFEEWRHERGLCRKLPPVRGEDGEGFWPQVGIDDWCGSFKEVEDDGTLYALAEPPPAVEAAVTQIETQLTRVETAVAALKDV